MKQGLLLYPAFALLTLFPGLMGCASRPAPTVAPLHQPPPPALPPPVAEKTTAAPGPGPYEQGTAVTAPPGKTGQAVPPLLMRMPSPDRDYIENRIKTYQQRLAEWRELARQFNELNKEDVKQRDRQACMRDIEDILSNYGRLLYQTVPASSLVGIVNGELPDPWDVYRLDTAYLEGACNVLLEKEKTALDSWTNRFRASASKQAEIIVNRYNEQGRYNEAVEAYRNFKAAFPDRRPAPATDEIYGETLLRMNRLNEALKIFSGLSSDGGHESGKPAIRRRLADLLLAAGNEDKAREEYSRLADSFSLLHREEEWVNDQLKILSTGRDDERKIYADLLRAYISFDGTRIPPEMRDALKRLDKINPEGTAVKCGHRMLSSMEDRLRSWAGKQLVTVDGLVEGREFNNASSILDGMLKLDLPPDVRGVVQKALDDVIMAEVRQKEAQKLLREQAQAVQWEKAGSLLDHRRFQDAITVFSTLVGTPYEERAAEKIIEAADLAAAELRQQAADLFVKSRKLAEPAAKMELLDRARGLLREILRTYPQTGIIDKVGQNLKIIDEAILDLQSMPAEETGDNRDRNLSRE